MRWLVAWLVGWLADWMVGWFVRDHSCDGRRAPARAKNSQNPGRERSSARKEVGRSWFFLNEGRFEERIAEQIVSVFGPQADQTVDLDMLRFRKEMFGKCSSQQLFGILDVSLLRPWTGQSYPTAGGRKRDKKGGKRDKGNDGSSNVAHRSGDEGSSGKVGRKKERANGSVRSNFACHWCGHRVRSQSRCR